MDTIKICDKHNVLMIAHRGLSGLYTENTEKAFEEACKRSYYGVECDVHITSDGKCVIFHDDNTGRMCEIDVVIENTDFSTLRALKFKDGFSKMPTLEEYLGIIARYGKVAVIELKNHMPKSNVKEIIGVCERCYDLDKIVFISFDYENLVAVRELLPSQRIQFLTERFKDGLTEELKENVFGLDICYRNLTCDLVSLLRKNNIVLNCWTCDELESAKKLIEYGVDYITSNILE